MDKLGYCEAIEINGVPIEDNIGFVARVVGGVIRSEDILCVYKNGVKMSVDKFVKSITPMPKNVDINFGERPFVYSPPVGMNTESEG